MPEPPLPDETSALFFDLDGTLIEIAARPQAVVVPALLGPTLAALVEALDGAVAVVSGRPIDQIDALLRPPLHCVAGVHGAERRGADGSRHSLARPGLAVVRHAAMELARAHPALLVEHKPGAVALHFRQAPELAARCADTLGAAVERTPGMELQLGKMVVEAKPRGANKGEALRAFLTEAPFAGRRPWHFGDDRTDEAAFDAVRARGGVAVKVGDGATVAEYALTDPAGVRAWLGRALAHLSARRMAGAGR
jgi:trehalose 6-phosphate phosphatase